MPYTPIHWSISYLTRELDTQISLPALLVSTAMPDIEVPFIYILTNGSLGRLVLHSLLGALTLSTFLSITVTVLVYPPIISQLLKLDYKTVKDRCRLSWSLVAVCLAGNFSHIFIDILHHQYNPLFFPFTYSSFDSLIILNNWSLASIIVPLT